MNYCSKQALHLTGQNSKTFCDFLPIPSDADSLHLFLLILLHFLNLTLSLILIFKVVSWHRHRRLQDDLQTFFTFFFLFLFTLIFLSHSVSGSKAAAAHTSANRLLSRLKHLVNGVKVGENEGSKLVVGDTDGAADRKEMQRSLQTSGQF